MATTPALEASPPKTSFRHCAQIATLSSSATLIALGVIFGALLVINHYYLQCGPINSFSQLFGKYFYLPLEISGGLLAIIVANALIAKCCKDKNHAVNTAKKSIDRKIGATAALATVLAIGIIFGALIFASHYGQNLGILTSPIQQVTQLLGENFYLPLLISSAALTLLVVGLISIPKDKKPSTQAPPQFPNRTSKTLHIPLPEGEATQKDKTQRRASLTLPLSQPVTLSESKPYSYFEEDFYYLQEDSDSEHLLIPNEAFENTSGISKLDPEDFENIREELD